MKFRITQEGRLLCYVPAMAAMMVLAGISLTGAHSASAAGIVTKVVNSPLSAAGTVDGGKTGINVYLQKPSARGIYFMNPDVIGYGIPKGGRIEIEMARGFLRDKSVPLTQKAIMVVTGAPQQGLPGKKVGYTIGEGGNENTFVIASAMGDGLKAESLMSPAPGAKGDPVRQRGIKVFHIGFLQSAFSSQGNVGQVKVRIIDGDGNVKAEGSGMVAFSKEPRPQILPNNLPNKQRNHNWQVIESGQTLGKTPDTVPIALMLYGKATGSQQDQDAFKGGILGAGVLSTPQLKRMGFKKPASLSRYNGGLIVQDTNGDGMLDPNTDKIIGGVTASAPPGAKGMELRSLEKGGKPVLSQPAAKFHPKVGKRFGGAIMLLQFTGGSVPGYYWPTLSLLSDPDDLSSPDGSAFTYTVVVN